MNTPLRNVNFGKCGRRTRRYKHKLRLQVQQQSAAAAADTTSCKRQRSIKKYVVTSVVAADPCKPQVRCVGLNVWSTAALPSIVCDNPSEQQAAVPVVSTSSDARQFGQCTRCLRVLSLTTVGLRHSHGHGCPLTKAVATSSTT
jgi:hypothetical protein